ncbi:hypothetical protein EJ08DRAFT_703570 [Tothia fuscella]|uniref:Uncharacterized protein n=1 Tax=Tothia fuscella TaxID=1048955 RepID=A0A9P4TRI1_9PEZI|nr:hypothetical protein EJ08DRAFT_703570 [Tothia fuscella]
MNQCLNNSTKIGNFTFGQYQSAYNRNLPCGDSTYIRANIAGALYPWPYLVPITLIHGPVLWERIYHWEKVQVIALCLAGYIMVTTIMGYWSTSFDPRQVLVWMPLTVVLDCGAMLQLYFLISEKDKRHDSVWRLALNSIRLQKAQNPVGEEQGQELDQRPVQNIEAMENQPEGVNEEHGAAGPQAPSLVENGEVIPEDEDEEPDDEEGPLLRQARIKAERTKRAWTAIASILVFFILLGLQLAGLAFAVKSIEHKDFKVFWCSPLLKNMNKLPDILRHHRRLNKGIGCLSLDGKRQRDWLMITVVLLPFLILYEIFDIITVLFAPKSVARLNGVDLRRPWASMFVGIGILIALTIVSGYHSMHLPEGLSKSLWIFRHDPSSDSFGVCVGQIHASGARGSILAGTDGLLWFMNEVYLGPESADT